VGFLTATTDRVTIRNFAEMGSLIGAIAASGFRRFSTYRQATVAALVTNIMFGFLRSYVLLAVAGIGGVVAGYDRSQLAGYVWAGQGLLGVIMLWGWTDLADRIRSGDVVTDLLRPIHPVVSYFAADLGRAAHAMIFRFVPAMTVGAIFFDLYLPRDAISYPLFLVSTLLAVNICFLCRYLVNSTAFWLLDIRGANLAWLFLSGLMGGLYFPIRFLPEWAVAVLWFGTPGPSMLQAPMDILVERDALPVRFGMVGVQAVWVTVLWFACGLVQRRAERKLVIQGG
jgi:ABC-2 type transport system permease protein